MSSPPNKFHKEKFQDKLNVTNENPHTKIKRTKLVLRGEKSIHKFHEEKIQHVAS